MWMPAPTCRRMGSSKSGSKQQGTADTFAVTQILDRKNPFVLPKKYTIVY